MYYLILLMVLSIGFSQRFGEWRWANDTPEFTHDKEAHLVGSTGIYFFLRHKQYSVKESILYTFYLGLTKECIDAILPWEKYGMRRIVTGKQINTCTTNKMCFFIM